jgi:hypothetical protein
MAYALVDSTGPNMRILSVRFSPWTSATQSVDVPGELNRMTFIDRFGSPSDHECHSGKWAETFHP